MKKIDFKQPKYILPMVLFVPLCFLIYNVAGIFSGGKSPESHVVKDSINTALPEADEQPLLGKSTAMENGEWSDEAYTGIGRLGEEEQEKDETSQGYTESELDEIDKRNAEKEREARAKAEMERSLSEARRHVNSYTGGGRPSSRPGFRRSQDEDLEVYSRTLEEIQKRNSRLLSSAAERRRGAPTASFDEEEDKRENNSAAPSTPKAELVHKAPDKDSDKFHTLGAPSAAPSSLIKAIIDQTTKARTGTRLRFKLLDAVTLQGILLPKGTYLYGLVTGFENQRVKAGITGILVKDKFVKVNLSVYDTDGMEGFYVPSSLFRNFVREASSQAVQGNMNFNGVGGVAVSAEAMALQALQNVYSSATSAISSHLKEEKARIKYNTTVYLINASEINE